MYFLKCIPDTGKVVKSRTVTYSRLNHYSLNLLFTIHQQINVSPEWQRRRVHGCSCICPPHFKPNLLQDPNQLAIVQKYSAQLSVQVCCRIIRHLLCSCCEALTCKTNTCIYGCIAAMGTGVPQHNTYPSVHTCNVLEIFAAYNYVTVPDTSMQLLFLLLMIP